MSRWVLICHGLAAGGAAEFEGAMLSDYNVDAHQGRGMAEWTHDPEQALHFPDFVAAMEAWRTQSTVRPLREDGRPNRPLTAFSVEPRALP